MSSLVTTTVTAEKVDTVMGEEEEEMTLVVETVVETVVEAETTEQKHFLIDQISLEENTGYCYVREK